MKRRLVLLIILVSFFVSYVQITASQAELDELRREYDERQREIDRAEIELAARHLDIGIVNAELSDLNDRILQTLESLQETRMNLRMTETLIERNEQELQTAWEELDSLREIVRYQLRAMQELGSVGSLAILLQSTSLRDFLLRVEYVNNIIEQSEITRAEFEVSIQRYNEIRQSLNNLRNLLESQEHEYETRHNALIALHENRNEHLEYLMSLAYYYQQLLEREREFLEHTASVIHEMQERLDEEERQRLEQIARERAEREAAARERQQQATPAPTPAQTWPPTGDIGYVTQFAGTIDGTGNSTLMWPVPQSREISSPYGLRWFPGTNSYLMHPGIDIRGRHGMDVIATDSGRVALSGWYRSGGYTIVIYHGGGISTLYAHNNANLVEVGDWVERGQRIALLGSTGFSTGPHLHFEVRINNMPVDPMPFLN